MSLEKQWQNIGDDDIELSSLIKPGIRSILSKDPLMKIKKNLALVLALGGLISLGYDFVLIEFPVWQVFVCAGLCLAFTLWTIFRGLRLYMEIRKDRTDNNTLQELERHYEAVRKWIDIQLKAGLFMYPVSIAGGFWVGGSWAAKKTISEIMFQPVMLIALLVVMAVLIPISYYLARRLSHRAFGDYSEQLKQRIDALKL